MRRFNEVALSLLLAVTFATGLATAGETVVTVETVNIEKSRLENRVVTISGTVVKANNGIMQRNFIHIEDGTGEGDNAQVIVTSQETASPGDKVTVTGTVVLDTDFGFGYHYPLLIEKATIKKSSDHHDH